MMRSLSVRIVLAVLGTLLVSLVAFMATFLAMSGPANVRLIRSFQARQIEDGIAMLQQRGPEAAAAFIARLDESLGATHYLTDAAGRDLITGEDRSALLHAPRPWFGPPQIDDRLVVVESSQDGRYRLIVLAPPPFNIWAFVPYYLLILAAVACLCWLLAIGIVRPLRQVARAVNQFGRGDLSMRVRVTRRDEIGDLGHAFNDMAERLETLLTAERRLLQDISHELRSPLARLNIAIELARHADDRDAAATRLQREADRLTSLVGSLIEVTRLEGDPAAVKVEPLSAGAIVEEVVKGCTLEADARKCRIVLQNDTTRELHGHPELLRRAVENVVRNAIRYAPPDTDINVDAVDSPSGVAITVRDRGPGVPEADLPRLVQPFFRVGDVRDAASGGIGLGLSIASRAVRLHHGSLVVENADPGLRVSMMLPESASYQVAS
jgi:two-component system sensor histidine kinase CpxA